MARQVWPGLGEARQGKARLGLIDVMECAAFHHGNHAKRGLAGRVVEWHGLAGLTQMETTMRVNLEMVGTSPLLMHNVELSNPNNKFARAISELTSKSDKTREDHLEIARLEFMGSLYLGTKGPMIPAPNVQRCLVQAAKVRKEGKTIERALMPLALEIPLVYDGPRTPAEMWADERFQYLAPVSVGRAKVQRMRPRFIDWKITSEWELLTDVLDFAKFQRIANEAGRIEGLGDGRTKGFGRFEAKVSKVVETPLRAVNS